MYMVDSTPKLTVIKKNRKDGIYVWKLSNGKVVGDGNGNIMNIPAEEFDLEAISKITKAAHHYGYPEGKAEFWSGTRRVSDEEYSEQLDRMKEGYIPSETDIGAFMDAERGIARHGNG
jgi:hypothetical protein